MLDESYSSKYELIKSECEVEKPYRIEFSVVIPGGPTASDLYPEWSSKCSGAENSKLGSIKKIQSISSRTSNISLVVGFATIVLILLMFIGRWVYFGNKGNE